MSSASLDREYHLIEFARTVEAAAFIAALSRVLSSPAGAPWMRSSEPVEVWSHRPDGSDTVEVYLSGPAVGAARAAFAPVPVSSIRRGDALPASCDLVIGGGRTPAWGLADAERRLSSRA
jgi:hypothetical protein